MQRDNKVKSPSNVKIVKTLSKEQPIIRIVNNPTRVYDSSDPIQVDKNNDAYIGKPIEEIKQLPHDNSPKVFVLEEDLIENSIDDLSVRRII